MPLKLPTNTPALLIRRDAFERVGLTREAIDRLQQIIAQSWYWIGGFCAPSDTTTTPNTIPTATNAAFKRAVVVEHIG